MRSYGWALVAYSMAMRRARPPPYVWLKKPSMCSSKTSKYTLLPQHTLYPPSLPNMSAAKVFPSALHQPSIHDLYSPRRPSWHIDFLSCRPKPFKDRSRHPPPGFSSRRFEPAHVPPATCDYHDHPLVVGPIHGNVLYYRVVVRVDCEEWYAHIIEYLVRRGMHVIIVCGFERKWWGSATSMYGDQGIKLHLCDGFIGE